MIWQSVTRLGELPVLLPAVLLAVLAMLVGASRIALGAHSGSEVMAGWVLGGAAAALALRGASRGYRRSSVGTRENLVAARRRGEPDTIPASGRQQRSGAMSVAALLALGLWLSLSPAYAPRVDTHAFVTQLSLQLSGRATPWSRAEMLRERRRDMTLPAPDKPTRQRVQQASSR